MKKLIPIIVLGLFLIPCNAEVKEKETLYSQLSRAVIRLEGAASVPIAGSPGKVTTKYVPHGTAFFVGHEGHLFVVTARHVTEKFSHLQARVECVNKSSGAKEVIRLVLPRTRWVYHQNEGDKDTHPVDVASLRLPVLTDRSIKYFLYEHTGSESEDKNQLPAEDPYPPREILIFGFPKNIGFELREQRPFVRAGIVAMRTGKEFLKVEVSNSVKFVDERCVVIDAELFGGNSGGPVMNRTSLLNRKIQLLGLVIASNSNMEFGIVVPVSRIREVLDQVKDEDYKDFDAWFRFPK